MIMTYLQVLAVMHNPYGVQPFYCYFSTSIPTGNMLAVHITVLAVGMMAYVYFLRLTFQVMKLHELCCLFPFCHLPQAFLYSNSCCQCYPCPLPPPEPPSWCDLKCCQAVKHQQPTNLVDLTSGVLQSVLTYLKPLTSHLTQFSHYSYSLPGFPMRTQSLFSTIPPWSRQTNDLKIDTFHILIWHSALLT